MSVVVLIGSAERYWVVRVEFRIYDLFDEEIGLWDGNVS